MKSFLVHIYYREVADTSTNNENEIIGVVEGLEDENKNSFTSPAELWNILQEKNCTDSRVRYSAKNKTYIK